MNCITSYKKLNEQDRPSPYSILSVHPQVSAGSDFQSCTWERYCCTSVITGSNWLWNSDVSYGFIATSDIDEMDVYPFTKAQSPLLKIPQLSTGLYFVLDQFPASAEILFSTLHLLISTLELTQTWYPFREISTFKAKFTGVYLLLTTEIYWVLAIYRTLFKAPTYIISFDPLNDTLKNFQNCLLPVAELRFEDHRKVTSHSVWKKNNIKLCQSVCVPWSSVSHRLSLSPVATPSVLPTYLLLFSPIPNFLLTYSVWDSSRNLFLMQGNSASLEHLLTNSHLQNDRSAQQNKVTCSPQQWLSLEGSWG